MSSKQSIPSVNLEQAHSKFDKDEFPSAALAVLNRKRLLSEALSSERWNAENQAFSRNRKSVGEALQFRRLKSEYTNINE